MNLPSPPISRASTPRGRRRRRLALAAVAGVLALVAAGCSRGGGTPNSPSAAANPATGSSKALVMDTSDSWTTWSYSPYATTFPSVSNFVYLPLAIQSWPNLSSFMPQLAKSWTTKGSTLTLHLQPHANWQNGKPVTGTDVVDTILLDGANGSAVWNDITNVTAPNAKEVALTLRPGVPETSLLNDLFDTVIPYPASVWGRFVTPSLKQDDISYYNESVKSPSAALKMPAFKSLQTVLGKISKYDPKTMLGDGPYQLTNMTLQEAELKKWAGFYDASHITVPEILYQGNGQSQLNAEMLSGKLDFASGWLYMPPVIVHQWLKTADANLVAVPGTFQGVVIFDDRQYPFNITKVRQALAYALPIRQMDTLSWGTVDAHAVPPDQPDGLVPRIQSNFLSKSQLASLNTYAYSTSKAAALLQQAGFHKSGGHWIMPNGKPFKITLSIDADWTDQVSAFKVAATALTSFGIPATESEVENTTYLNDMHTGSFQMAAYCCTGASPNPIEDFVTSPMGSSENFTSSGADKGDVGIGYGPTEHVPGIGTVNIPDALNAEYARTGPGPAMDRLTWDWAKFVDQQVPYDPYAIFANQIAYSSKNFDWPSTKDPLWVHINNGSYALIVAQEQGSLHPK